MPFCQRNALSWVCCPPLRLTGNEVIGWPLPPKTFTRSDADSPEPSSRPRFVRYLSDWAICWSESTLFFVASEALPRKFAKGMAGMYWPNVPFGVLLNVREEAKLTRFASAPMAALDVEVEVCVSGRISSEPWELLVPVPNQVLRMSSRATVRPGSTENVVWRPALMPASPVGM